MSRTKPTGRRPGPKPKPAELRLAQLTVRMPQATLRELEDLASLYGTSLAETAARCIDDAWSRLTPEGHAAIDAIKTFRSAPNV